MPIRTHYPEPPRALDYFQGSRRVLQAGLVTVAVSPDPLSLPDPKLHLSTLWHGHVSLLQVGKVRHRCAVSDLLVGEQKAPSHGLSASFKPLRPYVPHCCIQPRCVTLVVAAVQELLVCYLNAQMGDGDMLLTQEIFLHL